MYSITSLKILNTSFQPYESHLEYLVSFLIDFSLYHFNFLNTTKAVVNFFYI